MGNTLFGSNYKDLQVGGGGYKPLPAGGYVCRILKAKLSKSQNGLPMIEAMIDIIDGEYTQYFSKRYEANKERYQDAKYPNNGILKVVVMDENGNNKRNFKSFVTAIEESNSEELPKDNDDAFIKSLKDKEIGVLYGREEFKASDGKYRWSTKPKWFRSVESIENGNFEIPQDQPLNENLPYATGIEEIDSFSAAEDSIPF